LVTYVNGIVVKWQLLKTLNRLNYSEIGYLVFLYYKKVVYWVILLLTASKVVYEISSLVSGQYFQALPEQ